MTQSELAAAMSAELGRTVRPLTVTRLEGGKRPIGVDELYAAASALGVSVSELFPGEPRPLQTEDSVRLSTVAQAATRASTDLKKAVRQWFWSQSELMRVLATVDNARVAPLLRNTAQILAGMSLDQLIEEATGERATDVLREVGVLRDEDGS